MNEKLLAVCVKPSGNFMYHLINNRKPSVFMCFE